MKKFKKNWKKIILGIVWFFAGLIVLFGVGIFLWMQTWKTYEFPNSAMSIKYPQNDSVLFTPEDVNNFGELIINKENKNFNLTVDTAETSLGCKNSLESCTQDITYLLAVHGLGPEKSTIKFHGLNAYLFSGNTTVGYENLLIFYTKDIVYTFIWTNNPQNVIENIFNQIKINLILSSVNFNN